ncbi:hypothetical protein AURDEDRAFT_123856 [Auricularia subglabra TFB-10046 SS5]|nr:hypothetical protein AURDEDRAFT_123856 [Auricularia subglabra TFB-10046 SS5]
MYLLHVGDNAEPDPALLSVEHTEVGANLSAEAGILRVAPGWVVQAKELDERRVQVLHSAASAWPVRPDDNLLYDGITTVNQTGRDRNAQARAGHVEKCHLPCQLTPLEPSALIQKTHPNDQHQ